MDFKEVVLKSITSKTISYPEIGNITYNRNIRARRLSISIKRSSEVRVTIPGTLSFRSAESFVLSKSKWIIEKVDYVNKHNTKVIESGVYKTRNHTLFFVPSSTTGITIKIKTPNINILYPEHLDVKCEQVQSAALKGIEAAFRYEAKELLPQRLEYLALKHGFKYNKLSIKKTHSRWGSCSSKNNINLSIFLMKLPDELIDYIILHELCHTVHKNHGPKFWSALELYTNGMAKNLSKEVKMFRTGI